MDQLKFEFDLEEGRRRKEEGIDLAAYNRSESLAIAVDCAIDIAHREGTVHMDLVRKEMNRRGVDDDPLGPAAGAVFRKYFEPTGLWTKSARVTNHASDLRVWRLKGN